MKHRIVILASLLLLGTPGAFAPANADLAGLERHVYSQTFAGEPTEARLERLEKHVFGQAMSGGPAEREARLQSALSAVLTRPPADPMTPPMTPPPQELSRPMPSTAPPRTPDATDYPTVTALEREIFGRDFIYDDVAARLSRLERKVFQQDYPQIPLVDRVDKLMMRYPGAKPSVSDHPVLGSLPDSSDQFRGSGSDTYAKLSSLEKKILGRENAGALITERLDRLEHTAFGRAYNGEAVDTRLTRLLRDYNASASRQAYSSPAARPPIQPRPSLTPAPSSGGGYAASGAGQVMLPPQRRNIQIGAGMSSASTYQFSPELLEMLPNDVRGQFQGGAPVGGGTVVYEERTIAPGFQTYGGPPMPYQNHYSYPGMTQQRTYSSTTVLQPPSYAGDPALLQELAQLEIAVLGQPNLQEPLPVRLSRLEGVVIGQMYPSMPDAERLENLKKMHRYRSFGQLLGGSGAGQPAPGGMFLGLPLSPGSR